jgi:hypothetical protein
MWRVQQAFFFCNVPKPCTLARVGRSSPSEILNWGSSVGFVAISPSGCHGWISLSITPCRDDFDEDSFVSRTHKDSQYRDHGKIQTFTLGQGRHCLRIYDKVAEIEQQSDKVWFF